MSYILIIDDDKDFANVCAIILRSIGHEVEMEQNINAGKEKLKKRMPDLLILDVMFPEDNMAGFKMVQNIQKLGKDFSKLRILMLTAVNVMLPMGFAESNIDITKLPVEEFLEKPIDFELLKTKVSELLSVEK